MVRNRRWLTWAGQLPFNPGLLTCVLKPTTFNSCPMVRTPQFLLDQTSMSQTRLSSGNPLVVLELKSVLSLWKSGRFDMAENKARAARANYPRDAVANYALAHILLARSKPDDALPFAEAAARLDPDNTEYLLFLGKLFCESTLYERALPLLQKVQRLAPNSFRSTAGLANYYFRIANGPLALSYYEKALNLAPEGDEKAE